MYIYRSYCKIKTGTAFLDHSVHVISYFHHSAACLSVHLSVILCCALWLNDNPCFQLNVCLVQFQTCLHNYMYLKLISSADICEIYPSNMLLSVTCKQFFYMHLFITHLGPILLWICFLCFTVVVCECINIC